MWARMRLSIGWADLAIGIAGAIVAHDRAGRQRRIERFWSPDGDALVSFSVRSGFDLLLQALALPAGSEILFSALNVKGMIKIAERHQLVPVPVDLDLDHMAPKRQALERAITPQTRAIVVAHLFGARFPLEPLLELVRRHDLLLIEDCAQAFDGRAYVGHPATDVAMFSFGPLKTATALGGAVLGIRDQDIREKMRALQSNYPVQRNRAHLVRLIKFAGLKLISTRAVFGILIKLVTLTGREYEDTISEAVRGVAKLGSAKKIRYRPSAALLALLERRLRRWRADAHAPQVRAGELLRRNLGDAVTCPGIRNASHKYWVFPILAEDPPAMISALRDAGFDGAKSPRAATIAPPDDRPELDPTTARQALAKLVILPCYPAMPTAELVRQAEVVRTAAAAGRKTAPTGSELTTNPA